MSSIDIAEKAKKVWKINNALAITDCTVENIKKVSLIICGKRQWTIAEIANKVGISEETCQWILTKDLNIHIMCIQTDITWDLISAVDKNPLLLWKTVTDDENWYFFYMTHKPREYWWLGTKSPTAWEMFFGKCKRFISVPIVITNVISRHIFIHAQYVLWIASFHASFLSMFSITFFSMDFFHYIFSIIFKHVYITCKYIFHHIFQHGLLSPYFSASFLCMFIIVFFSMDFFDIFTLIQYINLLLFPKGKGDCGTQTFLH